MACSVVQAETLSKIVEYVRFAHWVSVTTHYQGSAPAARAAAQLNR